MTKEEFKNSITYKCLRTDERICNIAILIPVSFMVLGWVISVPQLWQFSLIFIIIILPFAIFINRRIAALYKKALTCKTTIGKYENFGHKYRSFFVKVAYQNDFGEQCIGRTGCYLDQWTLEMLQNREFLIAYMNNEEEIILIKINKEKIKEI